MKKNNFLEGSFIATAGIIICKIIGLIYVIPFYAMITTSGATLYSFAYSIYAVFLSLSTSGIPVAMSKLVSEYNSLGYYNTKERIYKLGLYVIMGLGLLFFIILMLFAPNIASFILGNSPSGGNTVSDVTLVIRLISSALLIVPILSVTKGYLQGHKVMVPTSISNILEQIVRVAIILGGCYISLRIMHTDEKMAIGISVFAATIGAFFAYLYLAIKLKQNNNFFNRNEILKPEEKKFTTKVLLKQIFLYAIPFIIIDFLKSSYNLVDTLTVVRTLGNLGYTGEVADLTYSVIATWGNKLCMIIIAISMGLCMSLIPSLASDHVTGKKEAVNRKINQAIQALLFITVPMTIGLWFLARPVWVLFYRYDFLSIEIFKVYIFQAISFSLLSVLLNITQTTNNTKTTILTLLCSFIGNACLNIPMMYLCHKLWNIGYQGASVSTLITQIRPSLYLIYFIHKRLNVNFKSTFINSIKIILCTAIMLVSLMIISKFYIIDCITNLEALIQTFIYTLLGTIIYFSLAYKSGLIKDIFGSKLLKHLKNNL